MNEKTLIFIVVILVLVYFLYNSCKPIHNDGSVETLVNDEYDDTENNNSDKNSSYDQSQDNSNSSDSQSSISIIEERSRGLNNNILNKRESMH